MNRNNLELSICYRIDRKLIRLNLSKMLIRNHWHYITKNQLNLDRDIKL